MKQVLEVLGVVALVQGVLGLLQEFTGRLHGWGLVRRLGFLDGHELYASAALVVLALALFAAARGRAPG
ncbi:hypothetical protein ACF07B_12060 [Streptomyces sp. NPDC015532]|uniref:hypothetical protein n=1 Tax=Streptomyces sp. NPDC015532 TaxID=3364960 RepID=UPI0036FE4526